MNTTLVEMLLKMVQIRAIEELIAENFILNKKPSMLHLSVGQEGAAVGIAFAMQNQDILFGNHRSHAHYIACGGDLEKMIYEIYGHHEGCCHGYGGSMHMVDRSVGFVGSTPILGSAAPIGVGLGFAQKTKQNNGVAVIFIGDGAAEEGAFYESINLAGLMKCPVIFVIEDNKYCVNTTHSQRKSPGYDIKMIVEGMGALYERVDGQKVWEVFATTKKIRDQVLCNQQPAVLHVDTLRHFAHGGPYKDSHEKYRGDDNQTLHEQNCCIKNLKVYLGKLSDLEVREQNLKSEIRIQFKQILEKIEVI